MQHIFLVDLALQCHQTLHNVSTLILECLFVPDGDEQVSHSLYGLAADAYFLWSIAADHADDLFKPRHEVSVIPAERVH